MTTQIKGYELRKEIGHGGFGSVHCAYQAAINREVAIKFILPEYANQPDFIRRFESEAQLIARLEHMNIVPLYDYWRDPEGAYIVMRWLKGGSLKDVLAAEGALDLGTTASILTQICSALALAHRNGIIHRDLKPPNILLDEDGNAYLSDFGIAKDIVAPEAGITDVEMVMGSPEYISPEQLRGEQVSPRTDIYSLGVVLYEMLAGEHPFPNLNVIEKMYKHLNEPLPLLTNLPAEVVDEVNATLQRATAKNPAERYSDALEMVQAFQDAIAAIQSDVPLIESLTRREKDILKLLVEDKSNKEIAQQLFVEVATVKWYLKQIYKKLNVRTRHEAITKILKSGLISDATNSGNNTILGIEEVTAFLTEIENPYKGLRAFQSADVRDFFGREKITHKLLARMQEKHDHARFLAIVGPSGSGKSSLARAGLIPAIMGGAMAGSDKWFIIEMIPGKRPLDELEVALTRITANQGINLHEQLERDEFGLMRIAQLILPNDGSELLLVIDQFEEVFTLIEDEAKRQQFLNLLYTAATEIRSRVRIVVTLRADFYDRPLQYAEFGELIRDRVETVLPLTAQELERAITEPAKRVGVKFADGLVTSIVSEINYQPGALPLLQYALTELFERRDGRTITHESYQAIGKAIGALAKRADELYLDLSAEGQAITRQLFLRLVTLGEGTEDTRRRVARSELLALTDQPDLMDEVLDTYANFRLLSLDNDPTTRTPTVEVAHEAILREWERLRTWTQESREEIKLQRTLSQLAEAWQNNGRDNSFLVSGMRLQTFESWAKDTQLALTPMEKAFLAASIQARNEQIETEKARQIHDFLLEKRARQILRGLVGVFVVATLIASGLALFAFGQKAKADEQTDNAVVARQDAEREADVSQSLALAANAQEALLINDTDLAIALAIEANKIDNPPPQAEQALADAIYAPGTVRVFGGDGKGHTGPIRTLDISPDGKYALSGAGRPLSVLQTGAEYLYPEEEFADFSVRLWDMTTGAEIRRYEGYSKEVIKVYCNADNETAIIIYRDGMVMVWNYLIGEIVRQYDAGTQLAWDPRTTKRIEYYDGVYQSDVLSASISPDESFVLVSLEDSRHRWMLDLKSGQVRTIRGMSSGGAGFAVEIDASNRYALLGHGGLTISAGGAWERVDLSSSELVYNIGERFFVDVWDVDNEASIQDQALAIGIAFHDTEGQVTALALNNTGNLALISTRESAPGTLSMQSVFGKMMLVNMETGEVIRTFLHGYSSITDIAISPDNQTAVSVGGDQVILWWDIASGALLGRFTGHTDWITSVEFTPDGQYILTGSEDHTLRLWDLQHGAEDYRLAQGVTTIHDVAFSHNGVWAASASMDHSIHVWNIATSAELYRLRGHSSGVRSVEFTPDDRYLISGSNDGSIRVWDLRTGEQLLKLPTDFAINVVDIDLSPDGRILIASEYVRSEEHLAFGNVLDRLGKRSMRIRLWDMETGQELLEVNGHRQPILRVAMSDDNRWALTASFDKTAILWDLTTGEPVRSLQGHGGKLFGVDIDTSGKLGITASDDRTLILWDLQTGEVLRRFEAHRMEVYDVVFSPDGTQALSGGADSQVILWDVATGQILNRFQLYREGTVNTAILKVAFSPDGQYALASDFRGQIHYLRLSESSDEIIAWGQTHRYIRDLTCNEKFQYNVSNDCPVIEYSLGTSANVAPAVQMTPFWLITPTVEVVSATPKGEIIFGTAVNGRLTGTGSRRSTDAWIFNGASGQDVVITLQPASFTATLLSPSGQVVAELNSSAGAQTVTLTEDGQYTLQITGAGMGNSYSLTVSQP